MVYTIRINNYSYKPSNLLKNKETLNDLSIKNFNDFREKNFNEKNTKSPALEFFKNYSFHELIIYLIISLFVYSLFDRYTAHIQGFNVGPLNLTWPRAYRIEVKPLRDRLLLYKEHGRCPGVVSTFAHHRVSYDWGLFIYGG